MGSVDGKATSEQLEEKAGSQLNGTYIGDPVIEKRLVRKLDLHILPWIFLLWLLAFIDRSNIGRRKSRGRKRVSG